MKLARRRIDRRGWTSLRDDINTLIYAEANKMLPLPTQLNWPGIPWAWLVCCMTLGWPPVVAPASWSLQPLWGLALVTASLLSCLASDLGSWRLQMWGEEVVLSPESVVTTWVTWANQSWATLKLSESLWWIWQMTNWLLWPLPSCEVELQLGGPGSIASAIVWALIKYLA